MRCRILTREFSTRVSIYPRGSLAWMLPLAELESKFHRSECKGSHVPGNRRPKKMHSNDRSRGDDKVHQEQNDYKGDRGAGKKYQINHYRGGWKHLGEHAKGNFKEGGRGGNDGITKTKNRFKDDLGEECWVTRGMADEAKKFKGDFKEESEGVEDRERKTKNRFKGDFREEDEEVDDREGEEANDGEGKTKNKLRNE